MPQDSINNTEAQPIPVNPKQISKVNILAIFLTVIILIIALSEGFFVWRYYKLLNECKNEKQELQNQYDNLKNSSTEQSGTDSTECDCPSSDLDVEECTVSYTQEEQLMMEGWNSFENETYNYSFKYPQDWELTDNSDTVIVESDSYGSFKVDFYSEDAAEREIVYPMLKKGESTTEVYCLEAQKIEYGGDPAYEPEYETFVTIVITLENNETPYRIEISYSIEGASLSSDFADMYNLILKTVKFD